MKEFVFLSLGSNQGDRRNNILTAISHLDSLLGSKYSALSSIIETQSWGFESANFLNCVISYYLDIEPFQLLKICKDIENQMGRKEHIEYDSHHNRIYHDRIIDIDILLVGEQRVNTPELTIPHPLMHKRDFVLKPLSEIYNSDLQNVITICEQKHNAEK